MIFSFYSFVQIILIAFSSHKRLRSKKVVDFWSCFSLLFQNVYADNKAKVILVVNQIVSTECLIVFRMNSILLDCCSE